MKHVLYAGLLSLLISVNGNASYSEEIIPLLSGSETDDRVLWIDNLQIQNLPQSQILVRPAGTSISRLTLEQRSPAGILQPLENYEGPLICGINRDCWILILKNLPLKDLWRMRRVNNFFHLLVTKVPIPMLDDKGIAIGPSIPINEERIHRLSLRRLNRDRFDENLVLASLVARMDTAHRLLLDSRLQILVESDIDKQMRQLLPDVWRMRYLPGMNLSELKKLMERLNLPVNHGFLEDMDARSIAQPYRPRFQGIMIELTRALCMVGVTAGSMYLTWTMPGRISPECTNTYIFPAEYLSDLTRQNTGTALYHAIMNTIPISVYFLAYIPSIFELIHIDSLSRCRLKGRLWGESHSFKLLKAVIATRDSGKWPTRHRILCTLPIFVLSATPLIPVVFSMLFGQPTIATTGNITIADYIHACLKYNLPSIPSCCALTADGLLGGACPFINGNGITNFGEIILTAAPYTGVLFRQGLTFSLIVVQMFMVLYCTNILWHFSSIRRF